MKISLLSFFTLALLLIAGCQKSNDPQPNQPGADFSCDESPVTCDLTAANSNFAFDIFKKIHNDAPAENIFISPFSISTALTMTANGAAGTTFNGMVNTLRINDLGMPAVNSSYKELLDVLPALDPKTKLKLANSIWPQLDYPVLDTFLKINKEFYNSEVHPVDFRKPEVIAQVNKWVEDNTDGLIKETLKELPPAVVMLLINAIYFKGSWQTEFEEKATHKADFYAAGGVKKVDMMHIPENNFPYFANDVFQAIDLPYGDSIFSMTVFLPKEGHTVDEIISQMNETNWNAWLASFQTKPVQLYLPKFKMEYDIKLKRTLSEMGMDMAFSDFADFSKMVTTTVKIDEVIHKAFLEVNEKGTEAAAVTVVIIVETSAGSTPIVNVNRPFVFAIRDRATKSVLFMGKVMTI